MSELSIAGMLPGEVASYDPHARTCRVRIPGITDGSNTLPVAVFSTPLGDRADHADPKSHTEIRILPGDPVWLMFEAGDPRFPIIMGYRTRREGNPVDWRRWRHANIEMTADQAFQINATHVTIRASGDVKVHAQGDVAVDAQGAASVTSRGEATLKSDTSVRVVAPAIHLNGP